MPSLRLVGRVPGREEVLAFRYGEVVRSVEVDGLGRVVLRDLSLQPREDVVLAPHGGRPSAVFLSQDGRRVLIHQSDESVELWDASEGTRIAELGHAGSVGAALATNRRVGVAMLGRTPKLVDLDSGATTEVEVLGGPTFIAPDGRHAVVGGTLLDITTLSEPKPIRKLDGMVAIVRSHGFSNDSQQFAYFTYEDGLQIVRSEDGSNVLAVKSLGIEKPANTLRWTKEDTYVVSEGPDGVDQVHLEDWSHRHHEATFGALSPAGDSLVVSTEKDIRWVSLSDGGVLATVTPGADYAVAVFVGDELFIDDPFEERVVEGPKGDQVRLSKSLRRPARFDPRGMLVVDESDQSFGRLSPDARRVEDDTPSIRTPPAIAAFDFLDEDHLVTYGQSLARWSLEDGIRAEHTCPLAAGVAANRVAAQTEVAVLDDGNTVLTRDGAGPWVHPFESSCGAPFQVAPEAYTSTHAFDVLNAGADEALVLADETLLRLPARDSIEHHAEAVRDAVIGPRGDEIALREWDGVRIVGANGNERAVKTGPTAAAAWDLVGSRLAVLGEKGVTLVSEGKEETFALAGVNEDPRITALVLRGSTLAWTEDTRDEEGLVVATLDTKSIVLKIPRALPFAVSPDGSLVAYAAPRWIRVLDVETGREVSATRTELREINQIGFSPRGSRLAVVGYGLEVFEF